MRVFSEITFQSEEKPLISVVMPIYNQSDIIVSNLESVLGCMSMPFELILINDASEDDTHKEIQKFLSNTKTKSSLNNNLTKITYVRNYFISIFETKCDVLGFKLAVAPYVLEVQADMRILEKKFDIKLVNVLRQNEDLIAVSGRNCQTFQEALGAYKDSIKDFGSINKSILRIAKTVIVLIMNYLAYSKKGVEPHKRGPTNAISTPVELLCDRAFPALPEFINSGRAGYLDESIEKISEIEEVMGDAKFQIYISETVSRGPILFDRSKYLEVGGFNQKIFFLGFDDHDLFYRALIHFGFRTAFVPFNFESKLINSTNRKRRSLKQSLILEYLRYTKVRKFQFEPIFIDKYLITNYSKEIRPIL